MAFDPFHYFVKRQEDIERLVGGSKATFEALGIRTRDQLTESVLGIDSETLKRLTDPLGEQRLLESTRATFLANNAIESALASEVKALADISRYFTVDRLQINAALSGVPASATEIAAAVNSMAALTEAARIAAAGIGFDRFGVAAYARQEQERLARFTGRLAGTHAALMESLSGSMVFPAFVSRLPTADLFAHTTTVRIISPGRPRSDQEKRQTRELRTRVTKEAEAFLVEELPRIKPAFLQQYRGAKSVAIARGPDWWTHGGASLRKLLKGVLHTVAPTEVVLEWAARHHKPLEPEWASHSCHENRLAV